MTNMSTALRTYQPIPTLKSLQNGDLLSIHQFFQFSEAPCGHLLDYHYFCGPFFIVGWKMIRYGSDDFTRNWALGLIGAFTAFFINAMAMDATFGIQAIIFYTLLAMITILWRLNTATEESVCAIPKRSA